MVAAACLTLAAVHGLVWFQRRSQWVHLLFSLAAIGTAGLTFCELWLMQAQTIGEAGRIIRWGHLPFWVTVLSLVGFTRLYMRAGRWWLVWLICGLRTLSLILDFSFSPNLNFREITGLRHVPFLGETVSIPQGIPNPWMLVGQLSLVLLLVFLVDVVITLWRRGERRTLLMLSLSMLFFIGMATGQFVLVFWGLSTAPMTPGLFFVGVVAVMAWDMSRDALRAAQLADELRASEQQMSLAAEAANLGVWVRDLVRNEIVASDQWRALFGFSSIEPLDLDKFLERLHPDDRDIFQSAVAKATGADGRYLAEFRVVLPDGQMRWIISRGRVEFNGDGQPVRIRGVSADITERKRADEKFRLVVEASPAGIALVDQAGRITLVNTAAEQIFGYPRTELVGQSVELLMPERFHRRHQGQRADFFAAPSARSMGIGLELFALRKDGTEFPVEIGLSPIQTEEGIFVLTVIVDVTARKQAEAEVQRQRAELAHLSRVTMLGELSGSMAHELNQPLTAILSNAQAAIRFLAHDTIDLDEVRDILKDIVEQDNRAGEVIRRLRLLLKKGEVQQQPLDLNDVVQEVLKLMRSDLVNQNVVAHTELTADLPSVKGDRVQLQQVLLNLVMNACDAMHGNAPADRQLVLRTELGADKAIHVSVSDCGVGLAPDKLEQVFMPFYTTKSHGLGLGLSVCRTIITAHGGNLWAANGAERGAIFYFTIPALEEPSYE
jgi:PAS domain S-box-containing protein